METKTLMNDAQVSRLTDLAASLLTRYRGGALSLKRLVFDLEAVIDALEGIAAPSWVDDLRSEWSHLESVNASMLDDDRQTITEIERQSIERTLQAIES